MMHAILNINMGLYATLLQSLQKAVKLLGFKRTTDGRNEHHAVQRVRRSIELSTC